jgi:hypothetical protein
MRKIKTYRTKHDKVWITIYLEDHGFASNLGLILYKSKRAQNDWYQRKKNRRARRAAATHNVADLRCWAACARLISRVMASHKGKIYAFPDFSDREVLTKYLRRWGFEYSDGFWVRL